jgi:hypothetical protein
VVDLHFAAGTGLNLIDGGRLFRRSVLGCGVKALQTVRFDAAIFEAFKHRQRLANQNECSEHVH